MYGQLMEMKSRKMVKKWAYKKKNISLNYLKNNSLSTKAYSGLESQHEHSLTFLVRNPCINQAKHIKILDIHPKTQTEPPLTSNRPLQHSPKIFPTLNPPTSPILIHQCPSKIPTNLYSPSSLIPPIVISTRQNAIKIL
jgi:hypothetical protein